MKFRKQFILTLVISQVLFFASTSLFSQYEIITLDKNAITVNDPFEPKFVLDMATGPEAEIRMIGTGQLELNNISDIRLNSTIGDVHVNSKINIADSSTPPAVGDIKFTGDDFEGFTSTGWKSLTMSNQSQQTYAVGDYAQGGVVFWVTPDGKHGKVVSAHDITSRFWGNHPPLYPDMEGASSRKNGAANTTTIVQYSKSSETAADICYMYAYEGYDDWYMPAIDELEIISDNRDDINPTAVAYGGDLFSSLTYISSTIENTITTQLCKGYAINNEVQVDLDLSTWELHMMLRPVRAF